MKITDYVENRINKLLKGYMSTYSDIVQDVNQKEAVIKAFNRMVKTGKLAKQAKLAKQEHIFLVKKNKLLG